MKHNFGEKTIEKYDGQELPVIQMPKYQEARAKAIEMLENEKYKGILTDGDFWILMNRSRNKDKMLYTGLIISHNGCLKINDIIENKVKPEKFSVDVNGYGGSLVYTYQDEDVYEVGEVSAKNCKNDYPYAMAFKRCFDRVVLKKSKLAYAGIYSDSEADEFKENGERNAKEKNETTDEELVMCENCNCFITPDVNMLTGEKLTVPMILDIAARKFKKKLCWNCMCEIGKKGS